MKNISIGWVNTKYPPLMIQNKASFVLRYEIYIFKIIVLVILYCHEQKESYVKIPTVHSRIKIHKHITSDYYILITKNNYLRHS